MPTLHVPPKSSEPTELADWIELSALSSPNGAMSAQDLITEIRRAGSFDDLHEYEGHRDVEKLDSAVEMQNEELETMADAVLAEIENRGSLLGRDRYPFRMEGSMKATDRASDSPYAFLTALSFLGVYAGDRSGSGTEIFEQVSELALLGYLGGTDHAMSFHFGWPRRTGRGSFPDALRDLCDAMGGGMNPLRRPRDTRFRDDKLDLVAWIPHDDRKQNWLSVFGQCASGSDWKAKVNELLPADFCIKWMSGGPFPTPLAAFFVPHCLRYDDWLDTSNSTQRLLFDRLRISVLLEDTDPALLGRCARWTANALA